MTIATRRFLNFEGAPHILLLMGTLVLPGFALLGAQSLLGQAVLPAIPPCNADRHMVSTPCAIALSPLESKDLVIDVPRGFVQTLTAAQLSGRVELRESDADVSGSASNSDPYTNFAGLHSQIRVVVSAGQSVRVSNPSKDKPASATLTVAPAQPANATSQLEIAAQSNFAHAEVLRVADTHDADALLKAYDKAIGSYGEAGDKTGLGRALIGKADFILHNQGNAVAAAPVLKQVVDLLPEFDAAEAGNYWYIMGGENVSQGNYDECKKNYAKAIDLYHSTGDAANEAKVLDNLARVEFMGGDADTAAGHEKRATWLAEQAGDVRRVALIQEEVGSIDSTRGDFEASYQAYSSALEALKHLPPNPRMEAALWTDLSDFYTTLGDFGRDKDALDQASAIWKTTDYAIGKVDTENNYGDLYLEKGQLRLARNTFERALALAEQIHYERGSIGLLAGIGDTYLHQKDAKHAEDFLQRALARAEKAGQADFKVQLLCQLGDASLLNHNSQQAKQYYEQCRKGAADTQDTYNEIRSEGGLAHTAFEANDLDLAQSLCEQALAGIEATRGHLRNQDLQTSFFASQHGYYDLGVRIMERLDRAHPGEGYQWQAFLIAERARARTLLDEVTAANAAMGAASSQALLAQYEEVQRRLRQAESAAAQSREIPASLQTRIARFTASEHQLQKELEASAASAGAASQPPLTLASLQTVLPDRNAALIEYWVGDQASYAWRITRTGIRGFAIPPAARLEADCSSFRRALLAAVSPDLHLSAEQRAAALPEMDLEWKRRGAQVSQDLFPAGMLPSAASTVLIVGDGAVESVPFAALQSGATGVGRNGLSGSAVRNVVFLSEPSATIFSFLQGQQAAQRSMRLAIFTPEQASARSNAGGRRSQSLADLPFSRDEGAMLRTLFGADATQSFSGRSFSVQTLEGLDWTQFSIGHFAMHALLNERYAELTGLAAGDATSPGSDNLLWYGDICRLHARLDLVVLSACNTALGKRIPGEGLRGLTQAFFAAGSQRVLGTLWEVDDQASNQWMRYFYQALKQTHSPAQSLRIAQQSMASDPQWSAPYYWAGYVLAGDWRPLP